jgi:hypothetical protein
LGKIIVLLCGSCRSKFTHIVNAAQFSHFCIEDFQKEKETSKKKRNKSTFEDFVAIVHLSSHRPFWITSNAMDESVWMKFCSSCSLQHMQCHYGSMCLNEVQFTWAIENTYKVSSSHHGSNVFGRNSVHTGHPIMDEIFGWNSVHTGQCHHGSKCLDETQFTLGSVIMGQSVWMKLSSHWAMSSWIIKFEWSSIHAVQWDHGYQTFGWISSHPALPDDHV